MTQALITASGAGTWTVPANCPAGTTVTVEGWGGGGGGGSRSSGSAFGSGGGGGAYVISTYQLTPNDITNGVPYVVAASAAGGAGGDGVTGNATTFSTNNLNLLTNSGMSGAAIGSLPTAWTSTGTPTGTVVGVGRDATTGLEYIDVQWVGTTVSTHASFAFDTFLVSTASTAYCGSCYMALVRGSTTNITTTQIIVDDWTAADAFLAAIQTTTCSLTSTLTRFSGTGTTATTGLRVTHGIQLNWSAGNAINLTIRIAGAQIEAGTTPSAWKSTPGYLSAPGGARSNGASGGAGGTGGTGNGTTKNTGGAGAAFNAAGAGGGGSAGPDGGGNAGTTAGVGGQGDATTGGAGGAVSTTSPGNPGTANTAGGGGGGGLTTVGGTGTAAGAGGAPGGGGGGQVFWNGSSNSAGGAGATGQIRITYYVTNLLALAAADAEAVLLSSSIIRHSLLAATDAQSAHRVLLIGARRNATDVQSAGLSRATAVLRGAADAQTAAFTRLAAYFRTVSAATPQGTVVARLVGAIRGTGGAQAAAVTCKTSYLRAFAAASAESISLLATTLYRRLVSASDGQSAALVKAYLPASSSTGKALAAISTEVAALVRSSAKLLGAGSSDVATVARQVAFHKAVANSVGVATSLVRLVSALRGAVSSQTAGRRAAAAKILQSGQSTQAAAVAFSHFYSRAYSATSTQASALVEHVAHLFALTAASANVAAMVRSVGVPLAASGSQLVHHVLAVAKRVTGATSSQLAALTANRSLARAFGATNPNVAFLPTASRVFTLAVSAVSGDVAFVRRLIGRLFGVGASDLAALNRGTSRSLQAQGSDSAGFLFFYHKYLPLLLRRRVVRLPVPRDVSTMPPSSRRVLLPLSENVITLPGGTRRILLPREEDMNDYVITNPEPMYFSPFDPTDEDIFTFDWTNRGYANDAIVFASVVSIPAGVNFLGPAFINGQLVDITVGPTAPLQLPATYSLRCMAVFASGRISNYSIPFVIMNL